MSEWLLFNANSAIFQLYHGDSLLFRLNSACFAEKQQIPNLQSLVLPDLDSRHARGSPRFLCCLTFFFPTCWNRGTSESSTYGKQRICCCNSASTHFHVSWLSDFIFYRKPLYKSLHQSFFY